MANKQFRMEKRLGPSVCADISKYALKNQYVKFVYEKTTQNIFFKLNSWFFVGFNSNSASENSFFFTNIE